MALSTRLMQDPEAAARKKAEREAKKAAKAAEKAAKEAAKEAAKVSKAPVQYPRHHLLPDSSCSPHSSRIAHRLQRPPASWHSLPSPTPMTP